MGKFNLLAENWLPFITVSGEPVQLGIAEALRRSEQLRNMSFDSPLFEGALLRILLAILHRAGCGPVDKTEWTTNLSLGKFDENKLSAYFDKVYDKFYLIDSDHPFYQTPGLSMKIAPLSLKLLFPEIASGHNKTIFNHSLDADEFNISYADAAMGLIATQMYGLGGLFKKETNMGYIDSLITASLVRGTPVYAFGDNLFETLSLNLLVCTKNAPIPETDSERNVPFWERQDIQGQGKVAPYGYMHILAPQNRHILLVEEDGKITGMHMGQGEEPDQSVYIDPFFLRVKNVKNETYSRQLQPDRLLWRDSLAFFSKETCSQASAQILASFPDKKRLLSFTAYAIANDKANPLEIRKEEIHFDSSIIKDDRSYYTLASGIDCALKAGAALEKAVWLYFEILFAHSMKEIQKQKREANDAKQLFWSALDIPFSQFCLQISDSDSLYQWKMILKKTAIECFSNSRGVDGKGLKSFHGVVEAESILNQIIAKELEI